MSPQKPRVLHLIHSFLPVTENWVHSQLSFNTEWDSAVLCQSRQNVTSFPHSNVHTVHTDASLWSQLDMLMARARAAYRTGPACQVLKSFAPDIIHGHFSFESWRHLQTIKSRRLPLITTFYGLDINKLPRRWIWRQRYKKLFSIGAAFIVEGPFMGARLAQLGCPAEKINVIKIGVDIDAIRSIPRARDADIIRIMFVGLGREKKGSLDAAAAFAQAAVTIPGLRLECVGSGPYRAKMREVLFRAGVADKCTFHGFLPLDNYRALLGRCDLALVPSVTAADGDTEGGAPVTAIEAQIAGIPVIGTTHCDIPEIVIHGKTGLLCNEHDVTALTRNLTTLSTDARLRKGMSEQAVIRATAEHDIRLQVQKISEVYQIILDKNKGNCS